MDRRGEPEMGNNPQESAPVKLPLAPILSTPPSDHRRPSPVLFSTRRGSSIFSPTQTLDHLFHPPPRHHHHHQQQQPSPPLPPPPPPPQQHSDGGSPDPDPDPDPTTASASNPKEPPPAVMYKECLKNHAASMGAHVVDGCGEFMPGGQDGTPEALRCAACDCHRNFHRKEPDSVNNLHPGANNSHRRNPSSAPPPHLSPHYTMVSFGGGESSSEDLDALQAGGGHTAAVSSSVSKKRFRTKFKQEQKERMHEFATKLGWRIQKQDEAEVQQFCTQIGVQRQVFKVWMHNNKQAIKKQRDSDLSSHK